MYEKTFPFWIMSSYHFYRLFSFCREKYEFSRMLIFLESLFEKECREQAVKPYNSDLTAYEKPH